MTPKPKPKKPSAQHGKTYGEGGSGPTQKMFGKGDHTRVATEDSAGPQTPGRTSQKSKDNPRFAEGGTKRQAAEGAEGQFDMCALQEDRLIERCRAPQEPERK